MDNQDSSEKFTAVPNFVIESYAAKIGAPAFALYVVLKKFAAYQTGQCFPKIETLAVLLGVRRGAVHRSLKVLCEFGLIVRASGVGGKANHYIFPRSVSFFVPNCTKNRTQSVRKSVHTYKEELDPSNDTHLSRKPPRAGNPCPYKFEEFGITFGEEELHHYILTGKALR